MEMPAEMEGKEACLVCDQVVSTYSLVLLPYLSACLTSLTFLPSQSILTRETKKIVSITYIGACTRYRAPVLYVGHRTVKTTLHREPQECWRLVAPHTCPKESTRVSGDPQSGSSDGE